MLVPNKRNKQIKTKYISHFDMDIHMSFEYEKELYTFKRLKEIKKFIKTTDKIGIKYAVKKTIEKFIKYNKGILNKNINGLKNVTINISCQFKIGIHDKTIRELKNLEMIKLVDKPCRDVPVVHKICKEIGMLSRGYLKQLKDTKL